MSDTTYIVKVSRYGHVRNRDVVEEAAMEGRTVPPLVEYVKQGQSVDLDPGSEATKKAIATGAIEEPGASEKRQAAALQAEIDRLKAASDALTAQMGGSTDSGEEDKGPTLKELQDEAVTLGIAKSGNKPELEARIAEHKASLAAAG